jgi:hypothetical protein
MIKQAGLWIDHRKAVLVIISEAGEELQKIDSGMEKHVRFESRGKDEEGSAEDMRDRQFENRLNEYYDRVIAAVRDTDLIYIFGPGEAKHELEHRLERAGLRKCIAAVETVDRMTDRQIAAKVREHTRT